MGTSTHFSGQPVYHQVIKLLDKQQIKQISLETPRSEAYVKRLDGWTHLVIMLFGVLKYFDSLREVEIGMKAEVNKLHHLGIDDVMHRSTLAEANKRRPQAFFANVYAYLLERYSSFLADSLPKGEQRTWEKLLYMMDSTTITLFDNILKGVGRHPKSGKKKGGMKVHTVMKYHVGVPMVVQLTTAAKHDHYLLKNVQKKYISPKITIFEVGQPILAATSPGKNPKININVDDREDEDIGPNGAKNFNFSMDE